MKVRRFVIERNNNDTFDVIDRLAGEIVGTFSHDWRADKYAEELTTKAKSKDEPVVVNVCR